MVLYLGVCYTHVKFHKDFFFEAKEKLKNKNKHFYHETDDLKTFSAENRNFQPIQIFKFVFADLSRFLR